MLDPISLTAMGGMVALPLIFKAIANYRNSNKPLDTTQQVTPQNITPTLTPTPTQTIGQIQSAVAYNPVSQQVLGTQTSDPDYAEIERKIITGLKKYGGDDLPALKNVPTMMEQIKKYQFFRNNPYLLPQQAILETSGGRNITHKNNILNYGIRNPEINTLFSNTTIDDALARTAKEMGETGTVYRKFDTGNEMNDDELEKYANQYEPTNPLYFHNLREGIKYFKAQ